MNRDEVELRLKAFAPETLLQVSVPSTTGENRRLPILRLGHHGAAPDVVSEEPHVGLELFTPAWSQTDEMMQLQAAGARPVTIGEVLARLARHHDQTHIRIAVPLEGPPPHHRILHIDTIGFAQNAKAVDGRLPIELITELWDSLATIIRMDDVDMEQLKPQSVDTGDRP